MSESTISRFIYKVRYSTAALFSIRRVDAHELADAAEALVNSHAALVKALEEAKALVDFERDYTTQPNDDFLRKYPNLDVDRHRSELRRKFSESYAALQHKETGE